jgi:two-component system NtrC family sensor kinase
VVTVGSVQVVVFFTQQDWQRQQQRTYADMQQAYQALSLGFLEQVYTAERLAGGPQTRRLVKLPLVGELFDDVIVTSGRPPFSGRVYLNPRGAVHRDPDRFPRAAIYEAMAMAPQAVRVPVAGGYCYAIRQGADIAGFLWFRLKTAPPPATLPRWFGPAAVLIGTLVFAVFVFWLVRRWVGRPLQSVVAAASRVGAGDYGARLHPRRGVRELLSVAESFNAMAAKVEGHTAELQTAVREAVQAERQKDRALVVSGRLAAIGTLAAGVAHEINNPIGGMLNAVHRLLQHDALGDKQRQYLLLVQDGLQRVAGTARKLLDFTPRRVVAQPFALVRPVEGARALVDHRLQLQRVALVVDLPADLPRVFGDPQEIQQVLLNLFLNSLDALQVQGAGGRIDVRARSDGGRILLDVDDDGPGMDPKELGRVMDPFFSKKDRPDASGLGMFISYSIIRNHGGEIELESAPGRGFRVRITLPAAPP